MSDDFEKDKAGAEEEREEAIDRVDAHVEARFRHLAYEAGVWLASKLDTLTANDVRDTLRKYYPDVTTHDDRALGPVMRRLASDGVIVNTGTVVNSDRVRNHSRRISLWRTARR